MKSKIKAFLKAHPFFMRLLVSLYNSFPFNNKIRRKKKNKVTANGFLKKCRIEFRGTNNSVVIESGCVLKNCFIRISGSNNRVVFKSGSYAKQADICTEDDGNLIEIGAATSFSGKIHLACIEGTRIIIGERCLFSSEIVIRTGDSHPIFDMQRNRINYSRDVIIGDHVWVGHRVLINKGVAINNDNIVGTGSVLTKEYSETNSVIAGVPAKVVKCGVLWSAER